MAVASRTRRAPRRPDLRIERDLLDEGHRYVGGLDEVGRGAWAGPVCVGVVVIDGAVGAPPQGTNDSKALTPKAREVLRPALATWCVAWSLGEASAREIDGLGLTAALRLAACRAIASVAVRPDALVVDGKIDFISPRDDGAPRLFEPSSELPLPEVHPVVRADRRCGSVAAASVLAKVARDEYMSALVAAHPGYGFEQHKGYGTSMHAHAIEQLGLTEHHRRSWSFAVCDAEEASRGLSRGPESGV